MSEPVGSRTWLRIALVWVALGGLIFLGFTAVSQWENSQRSQWRTDANGTRLVLQRARDGHYYTELMLTGSTRSQQVSFMVDTGATTTSIDASLANQLGLERAGQASFSTANGLVSAELFFANVQMGDLRIERLRVAALPNMKGQMLLGMDVLKRFQMKQQGTTLELIYTP
jgi:aspartyl protease family protein